MKTKFPPPAPRELILTVNPKAGIRVRNGQVMSIEPDGQVDAKELADLVANEHVKIWPLFGVEEELLRERTANTNTKMGIGRRLDLSIFYKITAPDERLKSLAPKFRRLKVAEAAYIKPGVELTIMDNSIGSTRDHNIVSGESLAFNASSASAQNYTAQQFHLNSVSEGGIGVPCAWALEGGRGAGVNIVDAEGAWRFTHEDLSENQQGLLGGTPRNEIGWRNHGTAVFGVIAGDPNGFGITGMCPDAVVCAVSVFGSATGAPSPTWSAAAAIVRAADNLNAGDILLIEHHLPGPFRNFQIRNDQLGYIPVEWWPCNLAAIQYATDKGIIVIEAAGNGQQNLGSDIYDSDAGDPNGPFPEWWHNPFERDPIDSKAILVGAGMPPYVASRDSARPDRSRVQASNFGTIVDAQGWGTNVVTSGYGGLSPSGAPEDRRYTSRFNGTSSAAAMVTGAVGCLQGILRARGIFLEPLAVRNLLRDEGVNSAQQVGPFGSPATARIGPRPDLCRLIESVLEP